MSNKIEKVAANEANRVAHLTRDAALSKAYFYPIKGVFYLLRHRSLQKPLLSRLAPTATLAAGVVSSMFFFTYLPQVAVLAFVEGPAAPIAAIPLVLSESSTLVNVIARSFLVEEALVDTFDGTLVARGLEGVVKGGREVRSGNDAIGKLGKRKHSSLLVGARLTTPKSSRSLLLALPLLHLSNICFICL